MTWEIPYGENAYDDPPTRVIEQELIRRVGLMWHQTDVLSKDPESRKTPSI